MVLLVSLFHLKSHVLVLTLWLVDRNHMNDTTSKPVSLESHDFVYWLQTWPYKHLISWWCHLHSIYFTFCCLYGFVCGCLDWNWGLWIVIWFFMVWPCDREVLWKYSLQSCDSVTWWSGPLRCMACMSPLRFDRFFKYHSKIHTKYCHAPTYLPIYLHIWKNSPHN